MFFVLAYGFAWLCYVPIMLSEEGLGLMSFSALNGVADLCITVGSFGPLAAALLTAPRRELIRTCLRWRAPHTCTSASTKAAATSRRPQDR